MSVETAIIAILKADATVLAMVSTRIFPLIRPPDTDLPCIVYQKIDHVQEYHLSGESRSQSQRYQFNIYAATYPAVRELVLAVDNALNIYRGTISDAEIEHVEFLDEDDLDIISDDNEQLNEYCRRQDYMIHIRS